MKVYNTGLKFQQKRLYLAIAKLLSEILHYMHGFPCVAASPPQCIGKLYDF